MPRTATVIADLLAAPLRLNLSYAERLTGDIPSDRFGRMPVPKMNHPAFCFGHLSLYPDQVLRLLGLGDRAAPKDGFEALFKAGADCVEQDGRYPSKDEILGHYFERYHAVLEALSEIGDSEFARENPSEGRLKTLFPFLGGAVNFYLNNHHSAHLGQVSAWRRAAGLGPA